MKLFLLSPIAQKEETEKYCFKACGQIIIGGIDFMEAPWLPCRTEKCPYLEKELCVGKGTINNSYGAPQEEEIVIRKLINV